MLGEVIGETIVFSLLNLIGGTIRWIIGSFLSLLLKRKKYKYKEYLYGEHLSESHYDSAHGCINIVFGIAFIGIVILIFK